MIDLLTRQLNGDEGRRRHVYPDSMGLWTIGVGRLVDDRRPGSGLRDDEMDYLLANDIKDRMTALERRIPGFAKLDEARKGVLLNMAFQMGVDGLLEFRRTLTLVGMGKYDAAADQMQQSLWAKQTPERAQRMATQMRTGVWQFAPGA